MGIFSPEHVWQYRVDALEQDLQRLEALLKDDLLASRPGLKGAFGVLLSPLNNRLKEHGADPPADMRSRWQALARLHRRVQAVINAELEILGGLAIAVGVDPYEEEAGFDDGFTARATEWLNKLCQDAGLATPRPLTVVAGRGPLLERETGLVRLSFLDWDMWHLPLLARAAGLLASAPCPENEEGQRIPDPVRDRLVDQVNNLFAQDEPPADLDRMLPAVTDLWRGYRYAADDAAREAYRADHAARLARVARQQCAYLAYLLADMAATALLGPAYAYPVFILQLDYANPTQYALPDPDLIEGRDAAERYLPPPAHRAAAILATLEAMDGEEERPSYKPGPYTAVIHDLTALWAELSTAAIRPAPLEEVRQRFAPWHETLYRDVIRDRWRVRMKETETSWRAAEEVWLPVLRGSGQRPAGQPPLTELCGGLWLYRTKYPDRADDALDMARLIREEKPFVGRTGSGASYAHQVAGGRLNRLRWRRRRWQQILLDPAIPEADRTGVAGRFFRLLSEQEVEAERISLALAGERVRGSVWSLLADREHASRFLRREALEFLGGLLIHLAELDHDTRPGGNQPGPSICDLADSMLREYAEQTGVNWSARTVLGQNPFLAADTDVIRVRFPDWSVWNLPLMAHEFGHLVALNTPAFLTLQAEETALLLEDHAHPELRRRHLDEFFADIFAAYTCGPAFAADVVLLQFDPAEAHKPRGAHPSHAERVAVILQTIEAMNDGLRARPSDPGPYGPWLQELHDLWQQAADAPDDDDAFEGDLRQSRRWGRRLFRLIDRSYRLGAAYDDRRWAFARSAGEAFKRSKLLDRPALEKMAKDEGLPALTLADLIAAFWWARLELAHNPPAIDTLTQVANLTCRTYLQDKQ